MTATTQRIAAIEPAGDRRLRVSTIGCPVYAIVRYGRIKAIGLLFRAREGQEDALIEAAPHDSLEQAVQWARRRVLEWSSRSADRADRAAGLK